jgi:hypothetical protein
MSNEKMEKYKALYANYIDHAVELHNYHLVFIKHVGYDTGLTVRKNIRNMIALEREMNKTCKEAYFENKQNLKNLKQEERAELARLKAIPKKRGRPPLKGR